VFKEVTIAQVVGSSSSGASEGRSTLPNLILCPVLDISRGDYHNGRRGGQERRNHSVLVAGFGDVSFCGLVLNIALRRGNPEK
jgi:hypothetical protein